MSQREPFSRAAKWLRGWFWELQGYYTACRRYAGEGRAEALWNTMTRGWRD